MRLAALLVVGLILAVSADAQDLCSVEAFDNLGEVHAVVQSCDSIGTFSLGGMYEGELQKLTFNYPQSWRGTFTTFKVDGKIYCTSEDPRNCELADEYVIEAPKAVGNTVSTTWLLPEVTVTQKMTLKENKSVIEYDVVNRDEVNHTVGVRVHMDTMIGLNDGAQIYIPGEGLKTTEWEYAGEDIGFEYFKAYNTPEEPTIVATGFIDPKVGMTLPSKFIIADWKRSKDTGWDYIISGLPITGDSAVILYYELGVLQAGEQESVVVAYGSEKPVLTKEKGEVGLTEIVLGEITGYYCPGDNVSVKADVLSTNRERQGSVNIIIKSGEQTVFEKSIPESFPKDSVRTVGAIWTVPETEEDAKYSITAVLYIDSKKTDEIEKKDVVKVSVRRCAGGIQVSGEQIVGGAAAITGVMIFVGLAGIILTALAYLWINWGSVDFTKIYEGQRVTVTVANNTRKTIKDTVIEDAIPNESMIRVETMNVTRTKNSLRWVVGTLKPEEKATLEYIIKGGSAVGGATLTWNKGSKKI